MHTIQRYVRIVTLVALLSVPSLLAAQPKTLTEFFDMGTGLLSTGIILIMGMILLAYFMWGVFKYAGAGGDPEKRKQAVLVIMHGLIGLFVFVCVWAIITLLTKTFVGGRIDIKPTAR